MAMFNSKLLGYQKGCETREIKLDLTFQSINISFRCPVSLFAFSGMDSNEICHGARRMCIHPGFHRPFQLATDGSTHHSHEWTLFLKNHSSLILNIPLQPRVSAHEYVDIFGHQNSSSKKLMNIVTWIFDDFCCFHMRSVWKRVWKRVPTVESARSPESAEPWACAREGDPLVDVLGAAGCGNLVATEQGKYGEIVGWIYGI